MRSWQWNALRRRGRSFAPQSMAIVALLPAIRSHGEHGETHNDPHENEEPDGMGNDATVNKMLKAGRAYLQAYPGGIDDYRLKQAMALAAPEHTALQQQQALLQLRAEQAPAGKRRAAK